MKYFNKSRTSKIIVVLVLIFLFLIYFISYKQFRDAEEARNWVIHTHLTLERANSILLGIKDTESMLRGYVITKDLELTKNYENNVNNIKNNYRDLKQLTQDNPVQVQRLSRLETILNQEINLFDSMNQKIQENKTGEVGKLITDHLYLTNQIEQQINEAKEDEYKLLEKRQEFATKELYRSTVLRALVDSISIILLLTLMLFLFKNNQSLKEREKENALLNDLTEGFQLCTNLNEAANLCKVFGNKIIPGKSGAIYLLAPSRIDLDLFAKWPDSFEPKSHIDTNECWGLKKGRMHIYNQEKNYMPCSHYDRDLKNITHVCIPMIVQGDTLGLVYFSFSFEKGKYNEMMKNLMPSMHRVAQVTTLALVNLKLRETLNVQAMHDPLTGLYNRRYLEDSISKEISQAKRKGTQFAVLMLDLNHFKEYNDIYGHLIGDYVLREVGSCINHFTREYDTTCRFGGEEFLIILSETQLEDAIMRAEALRERIGNMSLYDEKTKLRAPTVSIGISKYPEHGDTSEKLIRAADNALFLAKQGGRNKVIVAHVVDENNSGSDNKEELSDPEGSG